MNMHTDDAFIVYQYGTFRKYDTLSIRLIEKTKMNQRIIEDAKKYGMSHYYAHDFTHDEQPLIPSFSLFDDEGAATVNQPAIHNLFRTENGWSTYSFTMPLGMPSKETPFHFERSMPLPKHDKKTIVRYQPICTRNKEFETSLEFDQNDSLRSVALYRNNSVLKACSLLFADNKLVMAETFRHPGGVSGHYPSSMFLPEEREELIRTLDEMDFMTSSAFARTLSVHPIINPVLVGDHELIAAEPDLVINTPPSFLQHLIAV